MYGKMRNILENAMKTKKQNDLDKLDGNKKPKAIGILVFLFTACLTCALYWLIQSWIFG